MSNVYLGPIAGCVCHYCTDHFRGSAPTSGVLALYPIGMILCPTCGNKRCPKANYHANACTHSNDTGQPGSAYP